MRITRRHLRRIIREVLAPRHHELTPGDEVLILPPGSSWGTAHVQVVEVLPNAILARDEGGYEIEIPYHDVIKKSTGQFNPVMREAGKRYHRLGGKGWMFSDRTCDMHNIPRGEAYTAFAILQEFGYSIFLPITVDSNNIAINDALAAYPGEYTYEDFKCAIQIVRSRS